jgi:hypothetical protein
MVPGRDSSLRDLMPSIRLVSPETEALLPSEGATLNKHNVKNENAACGRYPGLIAFSRD